MPDFGTQKTVNLRVRQQQVKVVTVVDTTTVEVYVLLYLIGLLAFLNLIGVIGAFIIF